MKISLEWLADYLTGPIDPAAMAEALTHGGLPVEAIEPFGADVVLDVEVTSNRADCLSYLGIAAEVSALLNLPLRPWKPAVAEASKLESKACSVTIESPDLCPHYVAGVVKGVRIGASPDWMIRRLEAMAADRKAARAISNVVDVTNYVMFETGQPLHAFDLDKLEGGRIIVRRARAGEKLVTLDGKERALTTEMLVIADAARPVALAGVMGGRDTEVTLSTKNILIESARFDPLSVRRTARALAMGSDSSYRFERGIDPTLPGRASLRAVELILATAGGAAVGPPVEAGAANDHPKVLFLRLEKLKRILGVDLPLDRVLDALSRLRLRPKLEGERIQVSVPSDRLDLNLEVDLVEEVARVVGYDIVPVREEIAIRLTPPDAAAQPLNQIHAVLTAAGYFEAVTFSFVSDLLADDFVRRTGGGESLPRVDANVRKADASLRPSLLPGLLEAARRNQAAGVVEAKLYEIGSVFWNDGSGQVQERRRLGLIGSADYREVRGVVEAILRRLDAHRNIAIIPDPHPGFAKGAAGSVEWGGERVGLIGKIDSSIANKLSLRESVAAAELDLRALLDGAQRVPQLRDLPRYPAIRRDLSLVLPESTAFERIAALVREVNPPLLEDVEYVTTYRGKPLNSSQKSVTITLIFRSPTSTLTSEEVERSVQSVISAASEKLQASLRS